MEFENDKSEYRSEKVILLRNCSEKEISNFVCEKDENRGNRIKN